MAVLTNNTTGSLRYRIFDLTAISIGTNRIFIYSRWTGKSSQLSTAGAHFLLSCQTFKTLQAHAEQYARQLKWQQVSNENGLRSKLLKPFLQYATKEGLEVPVRKKELDPLLWQLRQWVFEGFLVSENELLEEVKQNAFGMPKERPDRFLKPVRSRQRQISAMGIPTCNRPATLRRCLESFTDNFYHYGRTPDIIILDDSRSMEEQQENQSALYELKDRYPGNFYYMNRERRAAFARAIAQKADIEPEVMEFAFMGHPACDRSEGGCRNASLLLTRGQLALQTDDDTLCRVAQSPAYQPGLTLTSQASSDEYWFFRSYEEAIKAVGFIDEDFLGIHEQVLGKSPGEVISSFANVHGDIDIEKLQPSFLQNIESEGARIHMSLVGPVGDTCLFSDLYRLFLEGESFHRLVDPAEDYPWHLTTRQVIRSTTQPTISDVSRCIGMNFAIDNRDFLPPFMPVQARCDGIFGDLLTVCFPHALAGNMPYVLAHHPPEPRSRTLEEVFSLLELVRVNDIVSDLIYASQTWPYGENPKENLQSLGQYLMNIGSYPADEFKDTVHYIYASAVQKQIQMAEQLLAQKKNGPQHWKDHAQKFIEILGNSLLHSNFLKPADINDISSTCKDSFREIVYRFGQVLYHWPDIYKAMDEFDQDELQKYLISFNIQTF